MNIWWRCLKAVVKFHDYAPQRVTPRTFMKWIKQFPKSERGEILSLLDQVVYLNKKETRKALLELNDGLLRLLEESGVTSEKIVYVQFDDAGSSSPVILNILQDYAQLRRRGCRLIDGNNHLELYKATNEIGEGAIIYVDDFIGTGNQFSTARHFLAQQIVGTFSEFLLAAIMCEEGVRQVSRDGVEAVFGKIDLRVNRPLHPLSSHLGQQKKTVLCNLCTDLDPNLGLGYRQLSSMTMLYRNAPDTLPLLFRGLPNQSANVGLLPRSQDLPIPSIYKSV